MPRAQVLQAAAPQRTPCRRCRLLPVAGTDVQHALAPYNHAILTDSLYMVHGLVVGVCVCVCVCVHMRACALLLA